MLMGKEGKILIRSPLAFRGYLQNEDKGMTICKDGWIHTGDIGSLHNGYLKVLGRMSDIIKKGSSIIYPPLVEKMILELHGVSKVVVVGVPDAQLGENICACVVLKEGFHLTREDMVKCFSDACHNAEALAMTPAYFMFISSVPMATSKIDRKQLRKVAIEHFGL